jgi:hypothetical protein
VAAIVARNTDESMVECGGVCVWRESGVRWSAWQKFGFNPREAVFSLIYFKINLKNFVLSKQCGKIVLY